MKQFLYLDTDIVNSIIAQAQNGLEQYKETDNGETVSKGTNSTEELKSNVEGKASLLSFLKVGGEIGLKSTDADNSVRSSTSHEISEKILHDAAFNEAVAVLKDDIINDSDIEKDESALDYGSYFCIKREFSFIDMKYLDELFSDKNVIALLGSDDDSTDNNVSVEGLNRQQRRKLQREQAKKMTLEKHTDGNSDDQMGNTANVISAIRKIAPYESMLVSSDGFMIPLNEKFFRVDQKDLGFRYGGNICCLGFVTNKISDSIQDDCSNLFMTMQNTVNNAFKQLLPTNAQTILVCHPIAVYYDNTK